MKKVKRRTYSLLLLVLVIVCCMAVFLFRLAADGGRWVSWPSNQNVYNQGVLAMGGIYDRNGTVLVDFSKDGRRFAESEAVRKSTLHIVGDANGSIGTGALTVFAEELIGYNLVNGTYTLGGKGRDLYLTVDADLNAVAYGALDGRKGAVVVMDYVTGEILVSVSTPTYDPANKPEISDGDPAYEGVYLNRVFSSSFTPGSIFKIVTAGCAIDSFTDAFDRQYTCNGSMTVDGAVVTCTGTHGTIALDQALGHSCNIYFAQLALDLGGDRLARYAERLGLLSGHSVDGITTAAGSFTAGESGSVGLAWSGSGQYETLINPLSFVRMMGAIAGGGTPVEPRIVSKLENGGGLSSGRFSTKTGEAIMEASTAGSLRSMLKSNVTNYYGSSVFPGLSVGGKTGTAEVGNGQASHSWFAGFLDDSEHPLAIVVLVENGGSGLAVAGSVANTVLQAAAAR